MERRGRWARRAAAVAGAGALCAWIVLATRFQMVPVALLLLGDPFPNGGRSLGATLSAAVLGAMITSVLTISAAWRGSPWAVPLAVLAWSGLAFEVWAGLYALAWLAGRS